VLLTDNMRELASFFSISCYVAPVRACELFYIVYIYMYIYIHYTMCKFFFRIRHIFRRLLLFDKLLSNNVLMA